MYYYGLGVPQDYAEALKWYRSAAVGMIYENGAEQGHALALLAAGCVSLLISGCGCLGVDGRRAARKALIQAAKS